MKHAPSKKKSIDNLLSESKPVVLEKNSSLNPGKIQYQKHILEVWDNQNSEPRIQRDDFLVESSSTTTEPSIDTLIEEIMSIVT